MTKTKAAIGTGTRDETAWAKSYPGPLPAATTKRGKIRRSLAAIIQIAYQFGESKSEQHGPGAVHEMFDRIFAEGTEVAELLGMNVNDLYHLARRIKIDSCLSDEYKTAES